MVSFRCEVELLEAFQAFCEANNTNLTEQLTGFMESAVNGTVHTSDDKCIDISNDVSVQASIQSMIETQMAEIEARLEKKLTP